MTTPKWTPPPPAAPLPGATLPTTPLSHGLRYRPSAKTEVRITVEAERKRIGALTGAQVRAQRAARLKAERDTTSTQQPLELVTSPPLQAIGMCACERCTAMRTPRKATR
jgi:hypothetical protein